MIICFFHTKPIELQDLCRVDGPPSHARNMVKRGSSWTAESLLLLGLGQGQLPQSTQPVACGGQYTYMFLPLWQVGEILENLGHETQHDQHGANILQEKMHGTSCVWLQTSHSSSRALHRNCESNTRTSPLWSPTASWCPVQSIDVSSDGSTTIFIKTQSCENHLAVTREILARCRKEAMMTCHRPSCMSALQETQLGLKCNLWIEFHYLHHNPSKSLVRRSRAPLLPESSSPVLPGVIHPQCLVQTTSCQQTAAPSDAKDRFGSIADRVHQGKLLKLWASRKRKSCMTYPV